MRHKRFCCQSHYNTQLEESSDLRLRVCIPQRVQGGQHPSSDHVSVSLVLSTMHLDSHWSLVFLVSSPKFHSKLQIMIALSASNFSNITGESHSQLVVVAQLRLLRLPSSLHPLHPHPHLHPLFDSASVLEQVQRELASVHGIAVVLSYL
jgi:hypothetical protein